MLAENMGSGHAMTGNHESASKSAFAKSRGNYDMQLQNRKQKMAIIHVAKNQLGLDEDDYREILYSATKGKCTSAAQIETEGQFKAVMQLFEKLGFKNDLDQPEDDHYDHATNPGRRGRAMASPEQLNKICVMWQFVTRDQVHWEDALHAFLKKRFKVDHRRFLKRKKAQYVIEAIKDMYLRKILVAGCEAIGHNGEKVENQLIELYRFIAGHFTTEELIAVLTMHVYCNPQISNDSKIMLRTMGGMQFRSLINA